MSNSSEPRAFGVILFTTTFGNLELELFTKQCPKITRNFVQLCLDGYYNGTIFDRVEKDFIAIGGKPTTEETIDIASCPDEFHSRLKFSRRGLLATANTEKDANGASFFFTLGPAPELQNKHSIYGRLKGDSVYHLVDLNECPVDEDLVPISEKKIIETIVQENPFPELVPRANFARVKASHDSEQEQKSYDSQDYLEPKLEIKASSKKLSFYQDDSDGEEDEERVASIASEVGDDDVINDDNDNDNLRKVDSKKEAIKSEQFPAEEPDTTGLREESGEEARQKRLREIREQIQTIKRQIECESATKIRTLSDRRRSQDRDSSLAESNTSVPLSKHISIKDPELSAEELKFASKKGRHRERETLEMMENFKKKLRQTARVKEDERSTLSEASNERPNKLHASHDDCYQAELAEALELADSDAWLHHRFESSDDCPISNAKADDQTGEGYSMDDQRHRVKRDEADELRNRAMRRSSKDDRKEHNHRHHRSRSPSRDSRHRRSSGHSSAHHNHRKR